jgi:toxin CcdB
MASFTVYANPDTKSQKAIPFLVDIQSELLSPLDTRVVVPLYLKSAAKVHPISRLTPVINFQNKSLVAMIPELAGISKRYLGAAVGQLSEVRPEMLAAIDLLITGF